MPAQHKPSLLDAISRRVVIGDGAMGTMLQDADLTLDDFLGLEGCNEILNDTRPDVLREIHREYFAAGADAVETNTFGCNLPNLADYDIEDRIRELAEKGTRLAREAADEIGPGRDGMDRFVLGSMGPGTKLPTLGHAPVRPTARRIHRSRPRHDRRRCRRHPGRDLPGSAAGQGRDHRQSTCDGQARCPHPDHHPRHRRDDRARCSSAARSVPH
ncbi:MAG: homocysteine S-methyltransferase family protein [Rhodococcus sp. (in: high G+C Gram-positive bacteria)]|nr:homocysteine S-methyltransferase family protein [Rhodococcus sp. (in: high G+C Gram-positive bacteria)]